LTGSEIDVPGGHEKVALRNDKISDSEPEARLAEPEGKTGKGPGRPSASPAGAVADVCDSSRSGSQVRFAAIKSRGTFITLQYFAAVALRAAVVFTDY